MYQIANGGGLALSGSELAPKFQYFTLHFSVLTVAPEKSAKPSTSIGHIESEGVPALSHSFEIRFNLAFEV
jgi:hypothetical protein